MIGADCVETIKHNKGLCQILKTDRALAGAELLLQILYLQKGLKVANNLKSQWIIAVKCVA